MAAPGSTFSSDLTQRIACGRWCTSARATRSVPASSSITAPKLFRVLGVGKDFWEKVCLVTSKDQNLTKAHVKYLESLLIQNTGELGRCKLINGTAQEYINLPESDRADMAFFVEQIRTVLPVLGFDFLRDSTKPSTPKAKQTSTVPEASPRFYLGAAKQGIKAMGQELDGEFFVLKGSLARQEWAGPAHNYQKLHQQLCEEGVPVETGHGLRQFIEDYAFSSPSAAAAMVVGRAANGRIDWKVEGTGMTYGEWQEQQVNAAALTAKHEPA